MRGWPVIMVLVCTLAVWAAERTPLYVDNANSFRSIEQNGVKMQEMRGDVRMRKDTLLVDCQEAYYYPDSGIVIFKINVCFKDPHRILFADEVRYNEFTEEVYATSRVRVYQHDTLSVTSNIARYYERLRQGYLYYNVQMRHENRRILLTGDEGFIDHERKLGRVTGQPVLTERDSAGYLITKVRGDTIEYYGDEKHARVIKNVQIDRDSLVANGQMLDYWSTDRMAVLVGEPVAVRGTDRVVGDTIRLFFEKNEKLSRVVVEGDAVATSPADSGFAEPKNQMEGKTMTLFVTDGTIDSVVVEGTAIATYFIRDKNKKQGRNVTSGDRLRVLFDQRKISRIRVEGGTEGIYTPERLLTPMITTTDQK